MSVVSRQALAVAKLPVFRSVTQAYSGVLGKPIALAKIAALPTVVAAGMTYGYLLVPWQDDPLSIFYFGLLLVPLSYLGFAWLRFTLLGKEARLLADRPWTGAYAVFFGHSLLWTLWLVGFPGFIVRVGTNLLLSHAEKPWEYYEQISDGTIPGLIWLVLLVVCVFPLGRLLLAAPAIAAGLGGSPLIAWRRGSGSGLRLGCALILVALTLLVLESFGIFLLALVVRLLSSLLDLTIDPALEEAVMSIGTASILLFGALFGSAVFAELLAFAFRHLTGWLFDRDRTILERFE